MTPTNNERAAVAVLNSLWGSDTGWQYNIKLLPSFETDKYLESIDGHDIYLYLDDVLDLINKTAISQNEQQEAVGFIDEADDGIFGDVQNGIAEGLCKVGDLLYTSPPKQIPDGWKLVPIVLTRKQKLAMISEYEDATGGCRLPDGDGYDEEIVQQMHQAMLKATPTLNEKG